MCIKVFSLVGAPPELSVILSRKMDLGEERRLAAYRKFHDWHDRLELIKPEALPLLPSMPTYDSDFWESLREDIYASAKEAYTKTRLLIGQGPTFVPLIHRSSELVAQSTLLVSADHVLSRLHDLQQAEGPEVEKAREVFIHTAGRHFGNVRRINRICHPKVRRIAAMNDLNLHQAHIRQSKVNRWLYMKNSLPKGISRFPSPGLNGS